jgi:lipopolysaccharide export system protein LptC
MKLPAIHWRGIATASLLAAAVLSGWALWRQRQLDQGQTVPTGRADYVLEDFELVALDAQGRESFTLRAPRLARDPNAKTLDITTPLFLIPPRAGSQGAPWEVRSQTGWVSAKGEELRLRGGVTAVSTTVGGQPIRLGSEQLNVFPKDKRATSAVAVTLTQPGLIMNGRGLEADLNAKSAILKSDVKGRYESSPR